MTNSITKKINVLNDFWDVQRQRDNKAFADGVISNYEFVDSLKDFIELRKDLENTLFESVMIGIDYETTFQDVKVIEGQLEIIVENVYNLINYYSSFKMIIVKEGFIEVQNEVISETETLIYDTFHLLDYYPKNSKGYLEQAKYNFQDFTNFKRLRFARNGLHTSKANEILLKQTNKEFIRRVDTDTIIGGSITLLSILIIGKGFFNFFNFTTNYPNIDFFIQIITYFLAFMGIPIMLNVIPKLNFQIPIFILCVVSGTFTYSILTHSIWLGMLHTFILWGIPLISIIRLNKKISTREIGELKGHIYKIGYLSHFAILCISQQLIWLLFIIVWGSLHFLSVILNSYVRKYINPIIDIENHVEKKSSDRRNIEMPYAILFSLIILLLITGIIRIDYVSIEGLYKLSISIAVTVIGFLFAFQSIVSSSSLKTESKLHKHFELEVLNNILKSFEGILIIFFVLFIISTVGLLFLYFLYPHIDINLSLEKLYNLNGIPFTSQLLNISFFTIFICFLLMSFTVLFQLFLIGNLMLVPLRNALKSQPIEIIEESYYEINDDTKNTIKRQLLGNEAFNGMLMKSFCVRSNNAICSFYLITPTNESIESLILNVGKCFFEHITFTDRNISFEEVRVAGFRPRSDGKVFQISLNKDKYKFLNENNNLSWKYKHDLCFSSFNLIDDDKLM